MEHAEYTLAVAGRELASEARGGLESLHNAGKTLSSWPGIAERVERTGGESWRCLPGAQWQLRLLPRPQTSEPARVRVFLLEQSAAVVDGLRWMHEARFWLWHEGQTDLNLAFPAPVRVLTAAVDDAEAAPLQPDPSHLWLPLPGRTGMRCIRVRWMYNNAEPLEQPKLDPPTVKDALMGTSLWSLRIPIGWEIQGTPPGDLGEGAARMGTSALYRAEAQLHLSEEICKHGRDNVTSAPLSASQRRFALYCRQARRALAVGANRDSVRGANGQTLAEWLRKLQADNRELADQNGFEDVRAEAERQTEAGELVETFQSDEDAGVARFTEPGDRSGSFHPLPRQGTPISWHSRPGAELPELRLIARDQRQTRQALVSSVQWLGLLAAVWVLSFLPSVLTRLHPFWPEQIALLGALGLYLEGLTLIVLILLLSALGGRIFLLIRGVRSLLRRHRTSPSAIAPDNAQGS